MNITQLIEKLEMLRELHGDLPVYLNVKPLLSDKIGEVKKSEVRVAGFAGDETIDNITLVPLNIDSIR